MSEQRESFKRKAKELVSEHLHKIGRIESNDVDVPECEENNVQPVAISRNEEDGLASNTVLGHRSDYTNPNISLNEKLALWSTAHDISDEALNDLLDILKSSGRLDSSMVHADVRESTIIDDNYYLSDSCSTTMEIKKEFVEEPPQESASPEENSTTLDMIMKKLNTVVCMISHTNAEVSSIKKTLNRIENSGSLPDFTTTEDLNEILPDLQLPVTTIEELVKLDNFLSDVENCKKLANKLKFEAVELKKSLYCNFSSIGEKLISNSLAAEYSLCGQRGKMRFMDFKYICAFIKYTCKLGYENRNRPYTFSDIEQDKAIGSFLKYIKRSSNFTDGDKRIKSILSMKENSSFGE